MPEQPPIALSGSGDWVRRVEIRLRHRSGLLDLDLDFAVEHGWTALFAPSGAGKTTVLRLIAGLETPQSGRIVHLSRKPPLAVGETVLLDTAAGIDLPPHRRGVRMVAQRPALFPHLSVEKNLRYSKVVFSDGERDRAENTFEEIVSLCRISHLRSKMPGQLSGGERQRAALARALYFSECRLLLLDEPFTGLEASLRDDIIRDLGTSRRFLPILLVTHDIGEVFAANAHVLKMEAGRIVASGAAAEVLAPERERMLARLNGGS